LRAHVALHPFNNVSTNIKRFAEKLATRKARRCRAPVRSKASFMDDLLREFLTETSESLDTVDNQLVRFEQEPNNAKILDNIFRLVHTIKGTCGFLGLPRLEALAHAGETLMGKFRDGMPVTGEAVTLILSSIDRIKEILAGLEATEAEPEGTDQDLIDKLQAMVERGMAACQLRQRRAAPARSPPQAAGASQGRPVRGTLIDRCWSGRCVPAKSRSTSWSAPSARPRSKSRRPGAARPQAGSRRRAARRPARRRRPEAASRQAKESRRSRRDRETPRKRQASPTSRSASTSTRWNT
jgi:two-component system chemotaxis sensor kinase CheA